MSRFLKFSLCSFLNPETNSVVDQRFSVNQHDRGKYFVANIVKKNSKQFTKRL